MEYPGENHHLLSRIVEHPQSVMFCVERNNAFVHHKDSLLTTVSHQSGHVPIVHEYERIVQEKLEPRE